METVFELLGILAALKMAEHFKLQNPACIRLFNFVQTFRLWGLHFFALFKLPDPGTNIQVQSFQKFPLWPHLIPCSPPLPGITLIGALQRVELK